MPAFTLNNPGAALDDFFGYSVAISDQAVVVGAFSDDTGGFNSGSAYVYLLSNATPTTPLVILTNPGTTTADSFGVSVAISPTRVAVGANGDDIGGTNAGRAYVFEWTSATPTAVTVTLNNPNPTSFDDFGISVAISGNRVVVGAEGDDQGASSAGIAYVFGFATAAPERPSRRWRTQLPERATSSGFPSPSS